MVGQMYLLTTVTQGRRPLFGDPRLARIVVRALRTLSDEGAGTTHAFVIMPDHVHWLVTLSAGSLDGLVARAKSRSAREINALRSTQGTPVWQRGFHDHALRRDEDVREVARYIVGNPVRAGIVGNARDYPWWDAEWL
ncbi:MAG: transposase [Betaproteobacteria bacterium]|nr:transposase [Betaproteobacteria bacterium]